MTKAPSSRATNSNHGAGGRRYARGLALSANTAAVIERLILTLKQSIAWLTLVPLRRQAFLSELRYLAMWYNHHRPHMTLGGRTPNEVYHRLRPMHRQPRLEPRAHWPRRSPCAKPVTLVKGTPGARLACEITFQGKRRHLPVVTLKRAP